MRYAASSCTMPSARLRVMSAMRWAERRSTLAQGARGSTRARTRCTLRLRARSGRPLRARRLAPAFERWPEIRQNDGITTALSRASKPDQNGIGFCAWVYASAIALSSAVVADARVRGTARHTSGRSADV
eukprot:3445467-Prymnesium_polylepis.2